MIECFCELGKRLLIESELFSLPFYLAGVNPKLGGGRDSLFKDVFVGTGVECVSFRVFISQNGKSVIKMCCNSILAP